MVNDSGIIKRLHQLLKTSDLNVTTEKSLRLQLEGEFNIDLSERKKFLRDEIQKYLQKRMQQEEAQAAKKEAKAKEKRAKKRAREETQDGEEPKKRGGGGLMKLCKLSDELASFLGAPELPRTEVVKGIWAYIREHNLQDPNNKRVILCDGPLAKLLGADSTDMFQLNKLLTVHIQSIPNPDDSASKKAKEGGGKGGLTQPLPLSDALRNFLQCPEIALPRSEVVKRLWAYIKEKDLQDPQDRREIICDAALADLLKVDRFSGFSVTKLLSPHFGKASDLAQAEMPDDGHLDDAYGEHHAYGHDGGIGED